MSEQKKRAVQANNPGYMTAKFGCNCSVGAMCPHLGRKKKNDLRRYMISKMEKEFQITYRAKAKATVKAKATAKAKAKAKTAKAKAKGKKGQGMHIDGYSPKLAKKHLLYENIVLLQAKLDALQASHDLLQTDHDDLRQFVEFHIDAGE